MTTGPTFAMLIFGSPTLLAYLAMITSALIFWGRYPKPSLLTLIAGLMLFFTAVGETFYSLQHTAARTLGVTQLIYFCGGILHAAAMSLLVWAVFSSRVDDVPMASRFETIPPGDRQ